MFTLKNVLFPVDFSNRCRGAARILDALHTHFQAQITLVHVLPPPHLEYSMADLSGGFVQEYSRSRTEQVRKDLDYFLDEELKHFTLQRVLLEGDPARTLVEYSREHHTDLIVMPTHGYGGFRRFMLGSVTAKILHDADCPVFTGAHLEEAAEVEHIAVRKVGVALDLHEMSSKVLTWAAEFATACSASLHILHATPSVEGLSGEYFEPNWRERFAEEAAKRIAELQSAAGTNAPVSFEAGDPGITVSEMAKREGIDILVIGRGSTSGVFGRIRAHAYGIIRQSPCAVISV